jgi:hypothetical protein
MKMLYQSAYSEDTFLTAIAVLAGIVFVIILVVTFALFRLQNKTTNKARSPQVEVPISLPAERPVPSPFTQRPKIELTPRQRAAIQRIGGFPLMLALMFGLPLLLMQIYRRLFGPFIDDFIDEVRLIVFGLLSSGVAGAIGLRVGRVPWRHTILPGLLAGAGIILLARFQYPRFPGPWIGRTTGVNLVLSQLPIFLFLFGAGVFLLPLFDPAVRDTGPAPSPGKVVLTAVILTAIVFRFVYLGAFGHVELPYEFPLIFSYALAGSGMLFSLANRTDVGAWLGGVGIMLLPLYVPAYIYILSLIMD